MTVEVPLQEALFGVRCEAYTRCEQGRLKSFLALKMKAICSSETSFLTMAKRCKIPKDIRHCYRSENVTETAFYKRSLGCVVARARCVRGQIIMPIPRQQ
jgi:hypothetical protein